MARSTPFFANRENISGEADITGNDQEPANWGPPSLSFASGFTGLSDGQSSLNRIQTNVLAASFFYSYRSHNITAGGDFRRQQFNFLSQLMVTHGYIVFSPNYRGSDNLGNAYQRTIWNDAGDGPGRDVMAGIEEVK